MSKRSRYERSKDLTEILQSYGLSDEISNAVLVVWVKEYEKPAVEVEIPVIKEFLMWQSPVFKVLFNGSFKESLTNRVELPGKQMHDILDLLDYLYPTKELKMTDFTATTLLPLSFEYQIEKLKDECIAEVMKLANPRLEYISIAIKFQIEKLEEAAFKACAKKMNLARIRDEKEKPGNDLLTDEIVNRLIIKKAEMLERFMESTVKQGLRAMLCGLTLTYNSSGDCDTSHVGDNRMRTSPLRKNIRDDITGLIAQIEKFNY